MCNLRVLLRVCISAQSSCCFKCRITTQTSSTSTTTATLHQIKQLLCIACCQHQSRLPTVNFNMTHADSSESCAPPHVSLACPLLLALLLGSSHITSNWPFLPSEATMHSNARTQTTQPLYKCPQSLYSQDYIYLTTQCAHANQYNGGWANGVGITLHRNELVRHHIKSCSKQ